MLNALYGDLLKRYVKIMSCVCFKHIQLESANLLSATLSTRLYMWQLSELSHISVTNSDVT